MGLRSGDCGEVCNRFNYYYLLFLTLYNNHDFVMSVERNMNQKSLIPELH